jgi:membrane protease YdiL (CAAX protease family)
MLRGLGVALALRLAIFGVGALAARGVPPEQLLEGGLASFGFLAALALVQLAILWVGLFRQRSPAALGWSAPRGADVPLGALGGALAVGALFAIFAGLGRLEVFGFLADALDRPPRQELLFLGIGVLAAFTEETVYRGWLQPRFVARWGLGWGVLATAALFAVLHFQPAPLALAGKLAVGLVLGLLRARTGTLWAPAIAHVVIWVVFGMA